RKEQRDGGSINLLHKNASGESHTQDLRPPSAGFLIFNKRNLDAIKNQREGARRSFVFGSVFFSYFFSAMN
ncbi:MAG TPA: hypothetical protein VJT08_04435, partial [Terriglobales bacterium]|nr:hypothetical protein [Terriglobales bacterium]